METPWHRSEQTWVLSCSVLAFPGPQCGLRPLPGPPEQAVGKMKQSRLPQGTQHHACREGWPRSLHALRTDPVRRRSRVGKAAGPTFLGRRLVVLLKQQVARALGEEGQAHQLDPGGDEDHSKQVGPSALLEGEAGQ